MEVIAKCARPPDVYQLCLAMNASRALLTRLMNSSLIESMKLALKENKASFRDDIDLFASFVNLAKSLPPDSVAMSGSIVVQAALGVTWDGSDIDLYCTDDAAPVVRSWLIAYVHQVLVGIDSGYSQEGRPRAVSPGTPRQRNNNWDRDPVFHVEHWANAPNDGDLLQSEGSFMDWQWEFNLREVCRPSPVFFRDTVVLDGPAETDDALRLCVVRSYEDVLPIPHEPRICNRAGKDRKDCISINLVVMNTGYKIVDAIDDFDIDICKCKFDGHNFTIPNPKDTFARRTEPASSPEATDTIRYAAGIARESKKLTIHAMLRDVVGTLDGEDEHAQTLLSEVKSIERELNNTPCTDGWCASLELVVDTLGVFSTLLDDNLPARVLDLVKQLRLKSMENVLSWPSVEDYTTHNLIVERYDRLLKYKARGIDITPFPTVSAAMRTLPLSFAQLESDNDEAGDPDNYDWWPRDNFEERNPDLVVSRIHQEQDEQFAANEMKRRSAYFTLLRQVKKGLCRGRNR